MNNHRFSNPLLQACLWCVLAGDVLMAQSPPQLGAKSKEEILRRIQSAAGVQDDQQIRSLLSDVRNFGLGVRVADRAPKLVLYAELRKFALREMDPKFDASRMPRLNISPPDSSLMAGIDPASIADPKTRAIHEKDIAENAIYARKVIREMGLRNLVQTIDSTVPVFCRNMYSVAEDKELAALRHDLAPFEDAERLFARTLELVKEQKIK